MTATAAITVTGVLRAEIGQGVIQSGARLYTGLITGFHTVALLTDDTDVDPVNHWLATNGFREHNYVVSARVDDPEDPGELRLHQISRLRALGSSVDLVVEPNPQVAAHLLANGITVASFLHASYSRPHFRPDYTHTVRPWDALTAEVERQRTLRASDSRPEMETL